MELSPKARLWLATKEKPVLGEGRYRLLKAIDEGHSLKGAAQKLGISYKHAWEMVRDMERALGHKLVTSRRGGREWGSTVLTGNGTELLAQYEGFEAALDLTIHDRTFWEALGMKMSARNALKGKIVELIIGDVATEVKLEVEKSQVTAVITSESARALKLKVGDKASAVIKATDVMIGK